MAEPKKFRVLFVCIGNACRSPMAEAVALRYGADIMEPSSAGLYPLGRVAALTIETLTRNGYSTADLSSKPVRRDALTAADVVINISGEDGDGLFEDLGAAPKSIEDWVVADPYGADATTYQRILEQLEQRVRELAVRLRRERKRKQAP